MSYYDPIPYVLPEEDDLEEDFLEEEEDHVLEVCISRRAFPQYGSRCIFIYFEGREHKYEFDLSVQCNSIGEVSWSIDEVSLLLGGLNEAWAAIWVLRAAELMLTNFDFYWAAPAHEWNLPPAPVDCRVVIA